MKTRKIVFLAAIIFLTALGIRAMRPEASAEETRPYIENDNSPTQTPGGSIVIQPDVPTATPNGEIIIQPGEPTTAPGTTDPGTEVPVVPTPQVIDPSTEPVAESVSLGAARLDIHPAQKTVLTVCGCVTGSGCDVVMTSTDTRVVTVNNNGNVRGENTGKAKIVVHVLWCGNVVKEMVCDVAVTAKKVSYSNLRKKLSKQKADKMLFADEGSSASTLTLYDGLYWVFKVHPGDYTYGSGDETIYYYPKIIAKKEGDHSILRLGVELRSFVEIKDKVSRSFKTMKFSGGGKTVSISGSTTCRYKTIGSYIRWQIRTQGTFYLSADSNTHLSRLDTLNEILSVKKPVITVKDTVHNRKYKCKITAEQAKNIKKLIKKYKKVLKAFW
ncbi:MAG: Ig-like domain-containing protein [Eubacterium sp.]|nr:Ig-like domain-containing protein [Eubacterium sp.]